MSGGGMTPLEFRVAQLGGARARAAAMVVSIVERGGIPTDSELETVSQATARYFKLIDAIRAVETATGLVLVTPCPHPADRIMTVARICAGCGDRVPAQMALPCTGEAIHAGR